LNVDRERCERKPRKERKNNMTVTMAKLIPDDRDNKKSKTT